MHSDGAEGLRVSRAEIEQMASAAVVIRECRQELAARNTTLLNELTAGSALIAQWRHYPEGEVYDPKTHAQYFFHAHPGEAQRVERGHFHAFLRADGMPAGVAPLLLPELAVADAPALRPQAAPLKRGERDEVSHLIAIALDPRGEAVRLFTTNRWVTGETWYRAEDVIGMLDCFRIAEPEPPVVLNRWICALMRLFRPQITALLRARDETVMAWRRRRRSHVFEDTRLEITSSLAIDVDVQLAYVESAHFRSAHSRPKPVADRPPMAEGWEGA